MAFEAPSALAVSVAVWVVVTAAAVAVNLALVEPAGTATLEGTVSALSLLVRFTVTCPMSGAAFSVTVHGSDAAPVSDALPHESWLTWGSSPRPLSTAADLPRAAVTGF
jgi:hypothetical protein